MELNKMSAKCALRGWKLRRGTGYILTDKPSPKAKFIPPVPGEEVVARTEESGVIYTFSALFVEVLKKSDLYIMAIRDEIVSKVLRTQERYDCLIPVSLTTSGGDNVQGAIFEISMGGVRFMTAEDMPFASGDKLRATFFPGGLDKVADMEVEVLRSVLATGKPKYAAKVTNMGANNEAVMRNYMDFRSKWSCRGF